MKAILNRPIEAFACFRLHFLAAILMIIGWAQSCSAEQHIAWVPSLKQALTEAKQTGRAILLTSAAPSCGGVPGVW